MKKSTKLSAFTLIELLIVIAIIGILAGLMSGAIANVMGGANATKIGNNGRNIINALMQTNQDREAAALGNIWPKKESTKYSDANTYFGWLMEKQYLSGTGKGKRPTCMMLAGAKVEELEKNNVDTTQPVEP